MYATWQIVENSHNFQYFSETHTQILTENSNLFHPHPCLVLFFHSEKSLEFFKRDNINTRIFFWLFNYCVAHDGATVIAEIFEIFNLYFQFALSICIELRSWFLSQMQSKTFPRLIWKRHEQQPELTTSDKIIFASLSFG